MKRISKKISAIFLSFLMISATVFTNISPVLALNFSGKYSVRQYTTGYETDTGTDLIRFRIYSDDAGIPNYQDSYGQWGFCVQHGAPVTNGEHQATFSDLNAEMIKAARIAYLGFYSHSGWYGSLGAAGKLGYARTQTLIWNILGQSSAGLKSDDGWSAWKTDIMDQYNKWDKMPSFHQTTENMKVGETKTLTDINGVLQYYASFNYTKDGVTFSHTKGSNNMKVNVSSNCTKNVVKLSEINAKDNGISKYENSNNIDVVLFIDDVKEQDKICTPGYNDPKYLSMSINVAQNGKVELAKKDNKGNYVPNTEFKLSYNSDMSSPIGTYKTGDDGKVTAENIKPQTVYIQEVSVPNHLILDDSIKSVTVEANKTVSYTATNNWKQGYIQVVKKDAETGKVVKKAGTQFDIYNSNNEKITTIETNSEGVAKSGLLDYGNYYVKEAQAPNGYTIKVEVSENVGVVENGNTYEIVVSNNQVRGSVSISKEDSYTGKEPQGEATLEGAVYGVYAREDIVDPSNDGTVLYKAGTKIDEMTTDKEANASLNNLYLGKYYIQEITPSKGYTLDETKYNFDLTYENQNVPVVVKNVTVKERVKSQAFQIIKVSSDEAGEAELLKGAEFTIKAQKDIDKYGSWEKAPIAKNYKGETASIMVTDDKGYAVSDRLPYGTYIVRETKTPDDKYKVADFKVTITEDNSEPQVWRVFNDTSFKSVLSIVKQDAETGKTVKIEGAKFKIKNLDTNEYFGYWEWNPLPHYVNEWTTDESGTVMTGEKLEVGNYQLEEVESPNGYLISKDPIQFKISSNEAYETLPDGETPVITVIQKDTSVKGKVNVEKRGEVLTGITNKDNGEIEFVYEEQGIAGAKYEVFARENILDSSNDGTVLYQKGTVVDTITTGADGKGQSKELPLGEYSVREVEAPNGFVINDEVKDVTLSYKDQNTAIVYDDASFVNDRQKVEITVTKKDKKEDVALFGAKFGLYASEDIRNNKSEIVVEKGTLIETGISDTNGNVKFKADLPLSTYEVKEIEAPIGYTSSDEVLSFDATYQGQDIKVIELQSDFENEITKVEVSKQDITDSSEIEGAHLTIFEKDDPASIYDTWISGQDGKNEDGTIKPHLMKGLEVGKTYILRETSSPHGFALAQDIEFTIKDTGEVQKVVMKDELVYGQLEWNKEGEIFNQTVTGQTEFGKTESPVWNKSNLLGAEITIYAGEDITIGNTTYYEKDEKVQTLESDWETVTSEKLPVGHYYYVETTTPHGYIQDTQKHYFEVKDTQKNEIQKITSTLENVRPKVNIDMTKLLEEQEVFVNKDAYKDIVFGVFAREDIYDYMGNVAIENGTMIYTSGINEDGTLTLADTFDLPNGVYYIQELSTNDQYLLNDKQYDFEIAYHGKDVAEYTVQIGVEGKIENELARGTIKVQKVDTLDAEKKLEGIEFNISANEDMKDIIDTVKTDKEGIATFEELELGTYYIQEAKQINGYILNDHIYTVEVTKDGDILTINCENQPTEMVFSKVDETGVKELEGATIQVIDKETGEIVDEWVSTNESHKIHYLVEGKEYIMKETTAPYGYKVAEEINFVANDGKTVTMKDELILTDIEVNKVDSQTMKPILSKDFEFTLYADKECKQALKVVSGNVKDGTATFKDMPYGEYYIKETKAPLGYELSTEVKKVVINENTDGVGDIHSFVYLNTLLPVVVEQNTKTGDNTSITITLCTMIIAGAGIIFLCKRKKHN